MAQSFLEQEREARAYNRAFLAGRAVGLIDGADIAIDKALETIDDWKIKGVETITMNGGAYDDHIETLKKMVADLKGGRV